jgi:hypothetical protein
MVHIYGVTLMIRSERKGNQVPTKFPNLLLDAAIVARLWRPLVDKGGNNFRSLNPTELHWITGYVS